MLTAATTASIGASGRSTPRVIIVGAAPGGLTSAILLAHSGADVTVLERLPRVGGRSGSIRAQGFVFDLGPTFVLYPAILAEIFATCGYRLEDEYPALVPTSKLPAAPRRRGFRARPSRRYRHPPPQVFEPWPAGSHAPAASLSTGPACARSTFSSRACSAFPISCRPR